MARTANGATVKSILSGAWLTATNAQMDKAVLTMATDIHRVAGVLAPEDTSALVQSGKIHRRGQAHYAVTFGGTDVPYAKRRHYENKKNPQTIGYLERAGDATSRNVNRYLEGA